MRPQKQQTCGLICDCQWGSKTCIQKRGYIWNYALNKWSRDDKGNIHRVADPECKYTPSEQLSWL